jgi:uncharacterized protein (TIGR02270 family)
MTTEIASIASIVSQFAENTSSLWADRERAVQSRVYPATFEDVARLDERIDAQLDGLRTCGEQGRHCVWKALELEGPGEIFTNAVLSSEQSRVATEARGQIEDLIQRVGEASTAVRPISVALDWVSQDIFAAARDRLANTQARLGQAVFLMASAMRGVKCPQQITNAFESDCVCLRQAAYWAALRLDSREFLPIIEASMLLGNPSAVLAARTGLLWGSRKAAHFFETIAASSENDQAETAAATLFTSVEPATTYRLHADLFAGKATRASIKAAGSAGTPEFLPFLLACLDETPLARLASDAISSITGLDLSEPGLTAAAHPTDSGPNEDPSDENVELDADESLSWPNPKKVNEWWVSHAQDFRPRTRYLAGVVVTGESLKSFIRSGRQRTRAVAAELAALRGQPWFDVSAPAFRQQQRLSREVVWQ